MLCKRCPHLVKHGKFHQETKKIEFKNICGLIMKAELVEQGLVGDGNGKPPKKNGKMMAKAVKKVPVLSGEECKHFPFPNVFDYFECQTYKGTFKSSDRKNDVIPKSSDFSLSESPSGSLTDMDLL